MTPIRIHILLPLACLAVLAAGCGKGSGSGSGMEALTSNLASVRPSPPEVIQKLRDAGKPGGYAYGAKDFFRNPEKTDFRLSPDGRFYSYLGPYNHRMNLFVRAIGDTASTRLTSEDRDIAAYFWAGNDRLVYTRDLAGDENYRLYSIGPEGGDPVDLTPYDSVRISLIDELPAFPDHIIIGMNREDRSLFEPYRLNVHDGSVVKLADNKDPDGPVTQWIADWNGELRVAVQVVEGVHRRILYRDDAASGFRPVMTVRFGDSFKPIAFDFSEPSMIYAASNLGRDKEALVRYDLATGRELEELFAHAEVDVNSLRFSEARQVVTHANYTTDRKRRHFFDGRTRQIYGYLERAFPGMEVNLVSADLEERKFLVRTSSDRTQGAYHFFDTADSSLVKLVELSPWLNPDDMAEMKAVTYRSRDGLVIHGYLTLPPDAPANNLPAVIIPHGGPWSRDTWGYDPEVQLLASRGYAVFQMNFRGSTGYGRAFWQASFREWGRKMQDDITDGVNWLVDQGIADPSRLAIYGSSFGGYAALAGLAFTPDLYACGVNYVGISNLHTFLNTIPPYWKPYCEMMYAMIGHPERDSALLAQASPVNFADSIRRPLLVVQGANNPRVSLNESDQIVAALRSRGIDVPYLVKTDEGHGFKNEENRLEFYDVLLGFLAQHLHTAHNRRLFRQAG